MSVVFCTAVNRRVSSLSHQATLVLALRLSIYSRCLCLSLSPTSASVLPLSVVQVPSLSPSARLRLRLPVFDLRLLHDHDSACSSVPRLRLPGFDPRLFNYELPLIKPFCYFLNLVWRLVSFSSGIPDRLCVCISYHPKQLWKIHRERHL